MKRSHVFAFIFSASLVATFHNGMRFAVIDQQAYLPILYRQLDPTLFSRDFLYQIGGSFGPRYFVNMLLKLLAQLFPIEPLTLAAVLLLNIFMLWITYRVAEEFFGGYKLTPMIAVVMVGAMGNSLFPLAPLITSEMDPRAMGMPLAMIALWLAMRGKPIWCAIVSLIGSLVHPLLLINVMAIALIGMGVTWLVGFVTRGRAGSEKPGRDFLKLVVSGLIFAVVSYLLWMVGYDISGLDDKTLFELVQFRTPRSYQMWNFWGLKPFVLFAVFSLAAIWSWLWWNRAESGKKRDAFTVLGMIVGTGLMLAGAVVFVEFVPVRLWLSLDASSGIFVARWLGFLLIANTAAQLLENTAADKPVALATSFLFLGGSGAAMPFTVFWAHIVETVRRRWNAHVPLLSQHLLMLPALAFALLLWIASGSLRETTGLFLLGSLAVWFAVVPERRMRITIPIVALGVLVVLVFALNGRIPNRKVYRATSMFHQVFSLNDVRVLPEDGAEYAAMVDIGQFARRHTPKDALVLTPPVGSLFRVSSRRSVLIDFKGMPGKPSKMLEWRSRLENCYGPWSNTGFAAVDEMDRNYRSISRYKLAELRREYGIDYAVLYLSTLPPGMMILHHNSIYAFVDLKPLDTMR